MCTVIPVLFLLFVLFALVFQVLVYSSNNMEEGLREGTVREASCERAVPIQVMGTRDMSQDCAHGWSWRKRGQILEKSWEREVPIGLDERER